MPSEVQQVERQTQPQNPAFLMQKPSHQLFSFSPCKQDVDFTTGLPPESGFSWSSINNGSRSNFLNTKSLKGTGRGFLGSLIGCFIPRNNKPEKEDDQEGIGCFIPRNNKPEKEDDQEGSTMPANDLSSISDHPIIHRDIKSSNILLTEKLRAKVADFGLARLAADDPDATHISTQVRGTAGYLDPEYLQTYQLTEKSDVYSFGVLLVELVTGRRPIDRNRNVRERITTIWAMQKLKERDAVLAMDPRLRRSPAAIMAAERVLRLAGECLVASRKSRPSMKRCAEVLWGIRRDFREMQATSSSSNVIDRHA